MGKKTTLWNYRTFECVNIADYAARANDVYHIQFANMSNNKLRISGDGDIMVHVDAVSKTTRNNIEKTSFVFENDGDVLFIGCGEIRFGSLLFENSGNVKFLYSGTPIPSKGSLVRKTKKNSQSLSIKARYMCFDNNGAVTITPDIMIKDVKRSMYHNHGDLVIATKSSVENATICCDGLCTVSSIKSVKSCSFDTKKDVVINSQVIGDCEFYNKKMVSLSPADPKHAFRITGKKTLFNNHGHVVFNSDDVDFNCKRVEFRNLGAIRFKRSKNAENSAKRVISCQNGTDVVMRNYGDVYLTDIYKIDGGNFTFDNVGDVNAHSISWVTGNLRYINIGNVYMTGIKDVYSPGHIYVGNYGKFVANRLTMTPLSTLKIASRGMIYLNRYIRLKGEKTTNCIIYTNESGKQVIKKSFLRRYNIKPKEGKVILYKVVSNRTKMAKYDNSTICWRKGCVIEIFDGAPWLSEIGSGKFIAAASPEAMYSLLKSRVVSVLTLEIDVDDLYEWPVEKTNYPQFIGFRRAKIIDDKTVHITTKRK